MATSPHKYHSRAIWTVPTNSTNKVVQPEQDTNRHHKRCDVPNVARIPRKYSTCILAGCSALAQTKYIARHSGALKILFFELFDDLELIESVSPWSSPTTPKPEYHSTKVSPFWDEPTSQHRGYSIKQYNIIIDILRGYYSEMRENVIK